MKSIFSAGALAVGLASLLAACSATAPQQPTQQSHEAVAPGAGTPLAAFERNGFLEQDVRTIAAYLAGDLPNAPAIQGESGGQARVVVSANEVRALDDGVVLDREAFAATLLDELRRHSGPRVGYMGRVEAASAGPAGRTSVRNTGGSGERRGGGGRSERGGGRGEASASGAGQAPGRGEGYLLQIGVRSLPAGEGGPRAQRYEVELVEAASRQPVWQGAFDIDAPAAAGAAAGGQ